MLLTVVMVLSVVFGMLPQNYCGAVRDGGLTAKPALWVFSKYMDPIQHPMSFLSIIL
jgi:hypothetical protein